jgi:hypothetical protein
MHTSKLRGWVLSSYVPVLERLWRMCQSAPHACHVVYVEVIWNDYVTSNELPQVAQQRNSGTCTTVIQYSVPRGNTSSRIRPPVVGQVMGDGRIKLRVNDVPCFRSIKIELQQLKTRAISLHHIKPVETVMYQRRSRKRKAVSRYPI